MEIKNILAGFDISVSGLKVQRSKMNAIADNIANAETTRTDEGGPYKKKVVVVREKGKSFNSIFRMLTSGSSNSIDEMNGAEVEEVKEVLGQPKMVFDPTHPDANAEGYVKYPDVNIISEMVNLISVSRAYEANVTVMNAAKRMALQALEI